jgi:hypothetical protein
MAEGDILVSYDVTSIFTNVPGDETIQILADNALDSRMVQLEIQPKA